MKPITQSQTTKYLIQIGEDGAFVTRRFHRRKTHYYCLETTYTTGAVLANTPPSATNALAGEAGLEALNFKGVEPASTTKLLFSKGVSAPDKKRIRKQFKENELIWQSAKGFKADSDSVHVVKGRHKVSKVPEFRLTLLSSEAEVCILRLTKDEFTDCAKNGMSYEQYEELDGSAEVSGATRDGPLQLEIDEKMVPGSDTLLLKLYKKAKAEALKRDRQSTPPQDQYAAIMDKLSDDSWRFVRIYESFDPKKLSMTVSFDKCLGLDSHVVETFELTYDGMPFELKENAGTDVDSCYLLNSQGESFEFDVLDEE
jgi:hypothetical protein